MTLRNFFGLALFSYVNSIKLVEKEQNQQYSAADLAGYNPINDSTSAVQDYMLDTGFWFEMCMNIQEAFSYCKPGDSADL